MRMFSYVSLGGGYVYARVYSVLCFYVGMGGCRQRGQLCLFSLLSTSSITTYPIR